MSSATNSSGFFIDSLCEQYFTVFIMIIGKNVQGPKGKDGEKGEIGSPGLPGIQGEIGNLFRIVHSIRTNLKFSQEFFHTTELQNVVYSRCVPFL